MAGRHSAKSSNTLIKVISTIAVIIIVIAAIVITVNFFTDNKVTGDKATVTTQQTTEIIESVTTSHTVATVPPTTEQGVTSVTSQNATQVVVIPTENGENISYFNATYAPYKAIDTFSDTECTLKEVFGSSYSGGVITFNSDGTFFDSVTSSSIKSGAYVVENELIKATYTNDKNMTVTVSEWDGDTPSELIINYGGYDVYFGL